MFDRNKRNYFRYIKYGLIIPLLILVYFLVLVLRPYYFHEELAMAFGENDLQDKNPRFFLEEQSIAKGVISPQLVEDDISYRKLYNIQSEFTIKPKVYPPDINKMSFSLDFLGEGADIYVEIPCGECKEQMPMLPLYLKDLEDYTTKAEVIKGKAPVFFYSRNVISDEFKDADNIEDWITKNLPKGLSLLITQDVGKMDLNKIMNPDLTFDPKGETLLDFAVYPGMEFFVQSPEKLKISLSKYNYNSDEGSDAFSLKALDLNNDLVIERKFDDDGIKDGSENETEQQLSFSMELPKKGIYKIAVIPEENEDFEINSLTLNTDKIIFTEIKTSGGRTFYTHTNSNGAVRVKPAGQNEMEVGIKDLENGEEQIMAVKDVSGKAIPLREGDYEISLQGNVLMSGGYFSIDKDSFFLPYTVELKNSGTGENILTKLDLRKNDDGQLSGKNYFSADDLKLLADKKDLKELPLRLRLNFPHKIGKEEIMQMLIKDRFNYVTDFCGLTIYSRFDTQLGSQDEIDCGKEGIVEGVKEVIPAYSDIEFYTDKIEEKDFYELSGIDDYSPEYNEFDTNVRGASEFAFYTEGNISMTLTKTDFNRRPGDEDVLIQIKDDAGSIVYEDVFADDGDQSNSKISFDTQKTISLSGLNGLFFLSFRAVDPESINDFAISKVNINTNKFIIVSGNDFYGFTDLFFNYPVAQNIIFRFKAHTPKKIRINDIGIWPSGKKSVHSFEPGLNKISTNNQRAIIANWNFAFAENSFFSFSEYLKGKSYIIIDNLGDFSFDLYGLTGKY